jgi:hypothetical protein
MPLGYGYIKREADSYVNWAKIGSDMSTMLATENKRREDIKADVDAKNREFAIKAADSPDGLHGTAKQAALDLANNASQFNLMQTRLLKSGKLKYKDFIINRQNLNDGIDRGFQALKNYQETFGKKMERYNKSISSAYELASATRGEGFGDFTKSGFFVNPINGKVNMGMKELQNVNGKDIYVMSQAPQNMVSTDYLDGIISGQWDRFDVDAATTKFSSTLGKEVYSQISNAPGVAYTGAISELMDITKRFNFLTDPKKARDLYNQAVNDKKKPFNGTFEEWMSDQKNAMASAQSFAKVERDNINATLANPFDRLSVLTDNGMIASNGQPYKITWDENEAKANKNSILMVRDAQTNQDTPAFTKEQEEDATNFAINQARLKYDKVQKTDAFGISRPTPTPPRYTQEWEVLRADQKQQQLTAQKYWNKIYTAPTPQGKKDAADALLGTPVAKALGIEGFDFSTPGKIGVRYDKDHQSMNRLGSRAIDISDNKGNAIPFSNWGAKGMEVINTIIPDPTLGENGVYGNNFTGLGDVGRQGSPANTNVNGGQILNLMFGGSKAP